MINRLNDETTIKPLAAIKVADFSWGIVGPLTIKYLTDFGAQAIRVESTTRLDILRTWGPFKEDRPHDFNHSGVFTLHNTGKLGVSLNLSHPKASKVVEKIVSWADVVMESFTPGVTAKLGLSYDKISKIKPDIIMVSASMQGQTGPDAKQPGVGPNLVGLAGLLALTGWPDRDPSYIYGAYTDFIAPHFIAAAILAAVDHRKLTGKGLYMDVSQLEASIHFMSPVVLDYAVNKHQISRNGNSCTCAAPHGAFRCRGEDRWCAIAVFSETEWQSFCKVIGNPGWTKSARFSTVTSRKSNEDELNRLVEQWTSNLSPEEVVSLMQRAGVPSGVVATVEDVSNDKQLQNRGHFQTLEHPEIGKQKYETLGFRLSDTPYELQRAPCLGEHNEYVYTKLLGFSDEEFISLMSDRVFE